MSIEIVPQNAIEVKTFNNEKADLLRMADDCLQRHRDCWALWLVSGDHAMFLQALNYQRDREQLLGQLGEVGRP
jgi:hypothetical protein